MIIVTVNGEPILLEENKIREFKTKKEALEFITIDSRNELNEEEWNEMGIFLDGYEQP